MTQSKTEGSAKLSPPWVEFLEGSLAEVERTLQDRIETPIKAIQNVSSYSINAGGKRFRPALVILGALAADSDCEISRSIDLASGVELLHLATLLHDDVVDAAKSRRGETSANILFGNKISVLVGDYLFARAFEIMAVDGDKRIIDLMAQVTVALSEGEVMELVMRGSLGELESLYWKMIERKTARLISACSEVGAISVGAPVSVSDALASYGERIGLAFQITDDLFDITNTEENTGKPVGADLMDGKVTLPYILTLKTVSPEVCECILEKTFKGEIEESDIQFLIKRARETGVPEQCVERAEGQVSIALKQLEALDPTPAKSVLEEIGPYLLSRIS